MNEDLQIMITTIADKNQNDIDKAVDKIAAKLRIEFNVPTLSQVGEYLLRRGIRAVIHDHRHLQNVRMREEAKNDFVKPNPKDKTKTTKPAGCATKICAKLAEYNWYGYKIAGRTLGKIKGNEIPGIIQRISSSISGQQVELFVMMRLRPLVPGEKKIEEAVPNNKIDKFFKLGMKK